MLMIVNNNICFSSADHEDQDVVLFNRTMLPAYYAILCKCCAQSRSFTRQLAQHQNVQWAFKNITPYPTQYMAVSYRLFVLYVMSLCNSLHNVKALVNYLITEDDQTQCITRYVILTC